MTEKVEPGTPKEQAVDEKIEEPKAEEPKVPSVEELTRQIEEITQEADRKETEIKRLQGILKDAQKRGMSKEELESLHKRIDDLQEWTAGVMDDFANRFGGDGYTESPPTRKSYRQDLKEQREKSKPESKKEIDPDIQEFITYLHGQGLKPDDELVKEAVSDNRTPQEALSYLKGKIGEKSQTMIQTEAEKIARNLLPQMLQEELKKAGLTTPGVGAPSASAKDVSSMSPDEKLQEGFKELNKKK